MQRNRSDIVERARVAIGIALACVLAFGILTLWVKALWAVAAVQAGILLLTALWLTGALVFRFPVRMHVLMVPLGGAVIWGCIQLATGRTIYQHATFTATLDWLIRLAAFWIALQVFTDDRFRRRILHVALWFGFILSVLAILQRYTAPNLFLWLFDVGVDTGMGPFAYHNQYAAYIETLLPIALLGFVRRPVDGWVYAVMASCFIASVVAANSRAGLAMLVLEVITVALLARGQRLVSWRAAAAIAGVIVLLSGIFVAAVGWEPLWQKMQREDQFAERPKIWRSSMEMATDRPVTGFGLGTWSIAYPAYATFDDGRFDNQAHNDWVQWAAEGGFPFLALVLLMGGLLLRPALRSVWGVGLLAVLLHCWVEYHFQQRPVFGYYYFVMAGMLAAEMGERSRSLVRPSSKKNRPDRSGKNVDVQPD